jgi:tRNA (cmo5U34)-methyltransferase
MNNWLNEDREQIEYYVSSKDIILVEREKQLLIMLDVFNAYFDRKENLAFLDIGCGDGALTRLVHGLFPSNTFHLLDGSKTMLDKARENIKAEKAVFIHSTFDEFFSPARDECAYDFIFSSMAIHHVEHHKKAELFSRIFTLLKHGGLFINIDVVLPSSMKTESIQFKMWVNAVNGKLKSLNRDKEIGTHDGLPAVYKGKPENKPSSLGSQLRMLEETGFRDVECWFKQGVFATFGGIK